VLYNGIDITVDLEVLLFWGAKIRAIVRTKAMYDFPLHYKCHKNCFLYKTHSVQQVASLKVTLWTLSSPCPTPRY
jgi:hypothetical protein